MNRFFSFLLVFFFSASLFAQTFLPSDPHIRSMGRIDFTNPEKPRISSSASTLFIRFTGPEFKIHLQDQFQNGSDFNYFAVELDGQYLGRFFTEKGKTEYTLADSLTPGSHLILISKATESQNGWVEFLGVTCDQLLAPPPVPSRKIEFIGNSITCGMGVDTKDIPCGSKNWFDQHNAYLAYGPLLARRMDAEWLLSSVSGIGVYRNWNSDVPVMPQVYDNLYLDENKSVKWDFSSYTPDLVTVCLGTNDFSDGDGTKYRAPLDSAKFVSGYLSFLKTVRKNYPNAKLLLISSPMLDESRGKKLNSWLTLIASESKKAGESQIYTYFYGSRYFAGCSSHPDRADQFRMADELEPVIRKIMNW